MDITIKTYIDNASYRAVLTAEVRGQVQEMQVEELSDMTANQKELLAINKALDHIAKPSNIKILTESKYINSAINNGWLKNWQNSMWINAKGEEVANQSLWRDFVRKISKHRYTVELY